MTRPVQQQWRRGCRTRQPRISSILLAKPPPATNSSTWAALQVSHKQRQLLASRPRCITWSISFDWPDEGLSRQWRQGQHQGDSHTGRAALEYTLSVYLHQQWFSFNTFSDSSTSPDSPDFVRSVLQPSTNENFTFWMLVAMATILVISVSGFVVSCVTLSRVGRVQRDQQQLIFAQLPRGYHAYTENSRLLAWTVLNFTNVATSRHDIPVCSIFGIMFASVVLLCSVTTQGWSQQICSKFGTNVRQRILCACKNYLFFRYILVFVPIKGNTVRWYCE